MDGGRQSDELPGPAVEIAEDDPTEEARGQPVLLLLGPKQLQCFPNRFVGLILVSTMNVFVSYRRTYRRFSEGRFA